MIRHSLTSFVRAQPGPGNVRSDRYAPKSDPMPEAESDYSGPEMLLDHWSEAVSYRLESYTDESEPLSTCAQHQPIATANILPSSPLCFDGEAVERTWPSQCWFEPATRPPTKSLALCSTQGPKWKILHAAALRQSGNVSLLTESDRYAPKSDLEGGKF